MEDKDAPEETNEFLEDASLILPKRQFLIVITSVFLLEIGFIASAFFVGLLEPVFVWFRQLGIPFGQMLGISALGCWFVIILDFWVADKIQPGILTTRRFLDLLVLLPFWSRYLRTKKTSLLSVTSGKRVTERIRDGAIALVFAVGYWFLADPPDLTMMAVVGGVGGFWLLDALLIFVRQRRGVYGSNAFEAGEVIAYLNHRAGSSGNDDNGSRFKALDDAEETRASHLAEDFAKEIPATGGGYVR